jgi:DnaJ-class molecular chaperone
MADLWRRLPWWGKALVVLAVLFMAGVIVYVVLKNALIVVFGVLLVFGIWCVFRTQKNRRTVQHHEFEHDSGDEADVPQFADPTEGQRPASREYDHPYAASGYHSGNEVHVHHQYAARPNRKRERSTMSRCARCDGQGSYVYFGLRRTCDACGGSGSVRGASRGRGSSGGQVVDCGQCRGRGTLYGLGIVCPTCNGKGKVRV